MINKYLIAIVVGAILATVSVIANKRNETEDTPQEERITPGTAIGVYIVLIAIAVIVTLLFSALRVSDIFNNVVNHFIIPFIRK